jgi:hypothetical protein
MFRDTLFSRKTPFKPSNVSFGWKFFSTFSHQHLISHSF